VVVTIRDKARRVLVADDEPAIRALCRVNLQLGGMEVFEADNGVAALEVVAREQPDLVLLDLMMPELDGWHVARQLASSEETRDLPIVVLSARSERQDIERAHEAGALGYVLKPFDPLSLAGELERTLQRVAAGEREQLRREMLE
jgi:two-component system, OmpR family, phosphate regulon response regulator PhoB